MPRHRITTASLLRDISARREAEASTRWQELSRDFMRDDPTRDRPETTSSTTTR